MACRTTISPEAYQPLSTLETKKQLLNAGAAPAGQSAWPGIAQHVAVGRVVPLVQEAVVPLQVRHLGQRGLHLGLGLLLVDQAQVPGRDHSPQVHPDVGGRGVVAVGGRRGRAAREREVVHRQVGRRVDVHVVELPGVAGDGQQVRPLRLAQPVVRGDIILYALARAPARACWSGASSATMTATATIHQNLVLFMVCPCLSLPLCLPKLALAGGPGAAPAAAADPVLVGRITDCRGAAWSVIRPSAPDRLLAQLAHRLADRAEPGRTWCAAAMSSNPVTATSAGTRSRLARSAISAPIAISSLPHTMARGGGPRPAWPRPPPARPPR